MIILSYTEMNHTEENISLGQLNDIIASRRLASTVILSILLVIGVTGNSIVLAVYGLVQVLRKSKDRFFIPYLAFFDLCAVLAGTIFAIMQNMYKVAFPSLILCKLSFFFVFLTTSTSACLLLVIAINRYLKICRPQRTQMSVKRKKLSLVILFIIVASLSSPMFYFLDDYQHELMYGKQRFVIRTCELSPNKSRPGVNVRLKLAYFGFILSLSVLSLISTVILYIPIGRAIYIRFRSVKKARFQNPFTSDIIKNGQEENETARDTTEVGHSSFASNDSDSEKSNQAFDCNNDSGIGNESTLETKISESANYTTKPNLALSLSNTSTARRKIRRRRQVRNNFTIMFMTIVIFYVISYIPTLALMVNPSRLEYWINLDPAPMTVLLLLRRMFLLNHVVNPFIYSYFDLTFRQKFKHFFKCSRR